MITRNQSDFNDDKHHSSTLPPVKKIPNKPIKKIRKQNKSKDSIINKEGKMNKLCNIITAPIRKLASSTTSIKRRKLPAGLRRNVWIKYNGENFNAKCHVEFCEAIITPFIFEVGHDVPVSKGGTDTINNLRPICRSCNLSMSNVYTITEYSDKFK